MAFKAIKRGVDVDPFGLGFLYAAEFTDGVTIHGYTANGRTVSVDGGPAVVLKTDKPDVRFLCPNDAAFLKVCNDHVKQFDAASAGSTLPDGDVDLSAFVKPTAPVLTPEEQAALSARQLYAQALQQAQQLKQASEAGADVDPALLADVKANLTKAVLVAVKAEEVAAVAAAIEASPVLTPKG